jgi:hypothetical protein
MSLSKSIPSSMRFIQAQMCRIAGGTSWPYLAQPDAVGARGLTPWQGRSLWPLIVCTYMELPYACLANLWRDFRSKSSFLRLRCRQTMATVTTTFHPDPTCFAPSNLWLDVSGGNYGCGTYYPPFSPRPTEIVIAPECPFTRLGRRNWNDLQCDQNNWVATGSNIYSETAYSACPDGMTGVATDTSTRGDGITVVLTACCPT